MRATTRVAVLVMVVGSLGACGMGPRQSVDQTYRINDRITELVLTGENMDVTIEAGDETVVIEETRRWREEDRRPRTTRVVGGGKLTVTQTGCGKISLGCETDLVIKVPKATKLDVRFEAGDLRLRDLSGDIAADLGAGDIDAQGLTGSTFTFGLTTGDMKLQHGSPPSRLVACVNTGDLTIRVPKDVAYAVNSDGNLADAEIDVRRDPGSSHNIQVKINIGSAAVRGE